MSGVLEFHVLLGCKVGAGGLLVPLILERRLGIHANLKALYRVANTGFIYVISPRCLHCNTYVRNVVPKFSTRCDVAWIPLKTKLARDRCLSSLLFVEGKAGM